MTNKQRRALTILSEKARWAEDFYLAMWPDGRHAETGDGLGTGGPSKGGPSYAAIGAAWYLGRLQRKGWCVRSLEGDGRDQRWTTWRITQEGITALREGSS